MANVTILPEGDAIRDGFVLMLLSLMMVSLASASPEMVVSNPNSASNGGQIPREEWNKTFGGSGDDAGTYCQQTRDGGYIIVGYTSSYGVDAPYSWLIKAAQRGDIWLIKTDSKGEAEWERTFGGLGKDLGFSVQQTNDDGFIIVGGKKTLLIGNYHIWLIKTDSKGNTEWDRTFEGSGEESVGFSVQQTNDSGYVIAGYRSFSDGRRVCLIKTDLEGNKVWEIALGKKDSEASFVQQTKDGGYIVTGYTSAYGAGKEDVWLIKTDSKGSWEWLKTFGGPEKDVGFSVNETEDGGYIITGVTESYGAGKGDVWLIKTDPKGIKEWDRTFGGAGFDAGTSVVQTSDDGYIITGCNTTFNISNNGPFYLMNPDNLRRVYLIKTDSKGNMEWDESFGGSRSD
jgi:hypothetical protein